MKWIRTGAAALIGILLAVVVFAPVPGETRWMRTLEDSGHGPAFGVIALLLWVVLRMVPRLQRWASGREYIVAFIAAVVLGGLSELAQIPTGRDASWMDWRNDILGAAAALALLWAVERGVSRSRAQRGVALAIALVLAAILATPLTLSTLEYRRRDASFPVLADFTSSYDRYFVEQLNTAVAPAILPAPWSSRDRESAMLVTFRAGGYPGVAVIEPPADWSAYESLAVDVTNPNDTELNLGLRVHDVRHNNEYADRYNTSLRLPAHTRRVVRISLSDVHYGPATRLLDLQHVAGMALFRLPDSQGTQMYLSRVWLEPAAHTANEAVTAR